MAAPTADTQQRSETDIWSFVETCVSPGSDLHWPVTVPGSVTARPAGMGNNVERLASEKLAEVEAAISSVRGDSAGGSVEEQETLLPHSAADSADTRTEDPVVREMTHRGDLETLALEKLAELEALIFKKKATACSVEHVEEQERLLSRSGEDSDSECAAAMLDPTLSTVPDSPYRPQTGLTPDLLESSLAYQPTGPGPDVVQEIPDTAEGILVQIDDSLPVVPVSTPVVDPSDCLVDVTVPDPAPVSTPVCHQATNTDLVTVTEVSVQVGDDIPEESDPGKSDPARLSRQDAVYTDSPGPDTVQLSGCSIPEGCEGTENADVTMVTGSTMDDVTMATKANNTEVTMTTENDNAEVTMVTKTDDPVIAMVAGPDTPNVTVATGSPEPKSNEGVETPGFTLMGGDPEPQTQPEDSECVLGEFGVLSRQVLTQA